MPTFQPLTIAVEPHGDVTVMRCAGEIDIATAGLLRARMTDVQVDGPSDLVVVLDDVTFLDSLGLGALISAHKRARVLQGSFTIVCTSSPVLRVFAATAMHRVFRIVDTLDEALEQDA
ncbi:STAS domain-containing protein [Nocardioides sp. T2.26MG-1]|uniref:STAS domain-containing protein n=1 Tax=Nocardioides sp. T2.26MG-1 TaxID=3041166 RepID=UPI002477B0E0|nr:STAS domain-containing protein [Nocardioides sp. T2.26MG-1]CAI9415228.1 Anti-sigma-B factor antagonist [Nocardioides sp. T2.26MG-1]